MGKKKFITVLLVVFALGAGLFIIAQTVRKRSAPQPVTAPASPCPLNGSYRINVNESDRLYAAVQDATSDVPFREQQRFFMDLSVRLTPPDLLAIECTGARVSVASSRAPKVSFVADGRSRQERTTSGNFVSSRITLTRDTLSFTSNGKDEDNLNVVFRSIDNGDRLRVIRRINAEQLTRPIIIQSVYDKLSDSVDWDVYDDRLLAERGRSQQRIAPVLTAPNSISTAGSGNAAASELRRSLDEWIDATNRRDIRRQMSFYLPRLQAFYLTRNTPISAVRAEKDRAFSTARSIDIRAAEPEIIFQDGGHTAVMRFRKQYRIEDRQRTRSGEVVQELRWQRTDAGWRILSERDVRVIR